MRAATCVTLLLASAHACGMPHEADSPLASISALVPTQLQPPSAKPTTPTLQFAQRLELLTPDSPAAYLTLAEDVLDAGTGPEHRALATRLLVLAYELDRTRGGVPTTAVSACLALADVLTSRREREMVRSLAAWLDPRPSQAQWDKAAAPTTSEATDYLVATGIGLSRSGDGGFARQVFRKPDVQDRVAQLDRVARRAGISGGMDDILREASRWPCPVCGNQRVEKRGINVTDFRFCSNCKGRPGTRLSRTQYLAQLRLESWLLAGTQRGWAAQVAMDQGAPLLHIDTSSLASLTSIDTTRPYFRNGTWVQTPGGEKPASQPALGPDGKPAQQQTPATPEPQPMPGQGSQPAPGSSGGS